MTTKNSFLQPLFWGKLNLNLNEKRTTAPVKMNLRWIINELCRLLWRNKMINWRKLQGKERLVSFFFQTIAILTIFMCVYSRLESGTLMSCVAKYSHVCTIWNEVIELESFSVSKESFVSLSFRFRNLFNYVCKRLLWLSNFRIFRIFRIRSFAQ